MTSNPTIQDIPRRRVLLAYEQSGAGARWLGGVEPWLAPVGIDVCRAHTPPDTIRRIERGGLSAAVLCTDGSGFDGLSLMRIIRSIDGRLPCWLVLPDTSRQMLEEALMLKVSSVFTLAVPAQQLTLAMRRVLLEESKDSHN